MMSFKKILFASLAFTLPATAYALSGQEATNDTHRLIAVYLLRHCHMQSVRVSQAVALLQKEFKENVHRSSSGVPFNYGATMDHRLTQATLLKLAGVKDVEGISVQECLQKTRASYFYNDATLERTLSMHIGDAHARLHLNI